MSEIIHEIALCAEAAIHFVGRNLMEAHTAAPGGVEDDSAALQNCHCRIDIGHVDIAATDGDA